MGEVGEVVHGMITALNRCDNWKHYQLVEGTWKIRIFKVLQWSLSPFIASVVSQPGFTVMGKILKVVTAFGALVEGE